MIDDSRVKPDFGPKGELGPRVWRLEAAAAAEIDDPFFQYATHTPVFSMDAALRLTTEVLDLVRSGAALTAVEEAEKPQEMNLDGPLDLTLIKRKVAAPAYAQDGTHEQRP